MTVAIIMINGIKLTQFSLSISEAANAMSGCYTLVMTTSVLMSLWKFHGETASRTLRWYAQFIKFCLLAILTSTCSHSSLTV